MFRLGSLVAVLGMLCAALLAAGCGGSDGNQTEEYRESLDEAHKTFNRELSQAGSTMRAAGRTKSREQYGEGAEQLQSATDDFKKELAELETPDEAKDEQAAVNLAVERFANSVGRINAAVQERDDAGVRAEAARVGADGAEVDSAIEKLKGAVD